MILERFYRKLEQTYLQPIYKNYELVNVSSIMLEQK